MPPADLDERLAQVDIPEGLLKDDMRSHPPEAARNPGRPPAASAGADSGLFLWCRPDCDLC